MITFICTVAPFAVKSTWFLKSHISWNFGTLTNPNTLKAPLFSFFYILGTYNPILLIYFFVVFIMLIAVAIIKKRMLKERAVFSPQDKMLFSLIAIIWLHSFIIDIVPCTKLGRAHFVIYPIFIIAAVSMFYFLASRLSHRFRKYMYALSIPLFSLIIFVNIRLCSELIRVKQYTPRYLSSHFPMTPLYILEEDVHGNAIMDWLEDFHIQKIKKSELDSVLLNNKRGCLIIGPTGIGSGLSILSDRSSNDFFIENLNTHPILRGLRRVTLPYFVYFPSFVLEGWPCEAIYFSGKRRVDYKSDSMNITLFVWGDEKDINN